MMRVIVTGGRDYNQYGIVCSALDALPRGDTQLVVIQGGAAGADQLARHWCFFNEVPCVTVPADWKAHGRGAGPIRNQQMIDEHAPDLVLAFPGGRGTADMVRRAKAACVPVRHFETEIP